MSCNSPNVTGVTESCIRSNVTSVTEQCPVTVQVPPADNLSNPTYASLTALYIAVCDDDDDDDDNHNDVVSI